MWKFIKPVIEHKIAKLGCFFVLALMMIAVTAITKVVLGWFHYDEKSKQVIGDQVAEYFVKGTLLILFILGGVMMVRDHLAEKRRSKTPPPLPTPPTPPLPLFSNRQRREASRSTHDKRRNE